MTGKPDGRRARGEARRRQLVDAALVVLGRDGLSALTHRAVAEEAGVPLASASYHFTGIDELIATAMQRVTDDLVAALAAAPAEGGIAQLARQLADEANHNRQLLLAEYEVYLYAARRPQLRETALAWLDVLCDTYGPELDEPARRALKATIEGVFLHAVLTDERADAATIEHTLRLAWPGATPPP